MSGEGTRIAIEPVSRRRARPSPETLGFGSHATDHMFLAEHTPERGWHGPRIVPYGPLALEPRALALHYGQTVFEGMKAYRQADGSVALFRPYENARRLNRSAARMAMPALPEDVFVAAVSALADLDRDWIPDTDAPELYLRPLLIAADPFLGVRPAEHHLFVVMACPMVPVSSPDSPGLRLLVREDLSRTAPGGIGDAKTAANYGPTVAALETARADGYDNLLWLDAAEHRRVEEAGITNVFVRYGREVVTPPLTERILAGITRDSVIALLGDRGFAVREREIDIETLVSDIGRGRAEEAFVTGTATVVAPVLELGFRGVDHRFGGDRGLGRALRAALLDIQYGRAEDRRGWRHAIGSRG